MFDCTPNAFAFGSRFSRVCHKNRLPLDMVAERWLTGAMSESSGKEPEVKSEVEAETESEAGPQEGEKNEKSKKSAAK